LRKAVEEDETEEVEEEEEEQEDGEKDEDNDEEEEEGEEQRQWIVWGTAAAAAAVRWRTCAWRTPPRGFPLSGRGLHSSTIQLKLSRLLRRIHPKHP